MDSEHPKGPGIDQGFVAHGATNLRSGLYPKIQKEVEAAYLEELNTASLWRRFLLRRKIKREIERRLADNFSEYTLF